MIDGLASSAVQIRREIERFRALRTLGPCPLPNPPNPTDPAWLDMWCRNQPHLIDQWIRNLTDQLARINTRRTRP